jgi:hypothetical protein
MPYHLDFTFLKLKFLEERFGKEDLIPSLLPLREGLADKLARLDASGISTLADLSAPLGKAKSLQALSRTAGVAVDYLNLLGRALRGFRPKPADLTDYPGVDKKSVAKLDREGITDSRTLWEAACRGKERVRLAEKTGIDKRALFELVCLADLSRIQWVSPLFARLLHDAGFRNVREVTGAKSEDLFEKVDVVNKMNKLYKGKIGLRDMGRLVYLSSLLTRELEA